MMRGIACTLSLLVVACLADQADKPDPEGEGPDPTEPLPTAPAPCEAELARFEERVWGPILGVKCVGCHNAEGPAKTSRMIFVSGNDPASLAANYAAAARMAAIQIAGEPVLLLRPSGRHPQGHTGGRLLPEDGAEFHALRGFTEFAVTEACEGERTDRRACEAISPGPRLIRRLTPGEYAATVEDLMGAPSRHAAGFAQDPVVHGFGNNAAALLVSPLLADQVRVAAEDMAREAVQNPGRIGLCQPVQGQEEVCADRFIRDFGARAFRRPLTDTEVGRYVGLYRLGAAGGFSAGIELVLQGILQSPNFLYRQELGVHRGGGVYDLTDHEIATQLAYLLTGSMPDSELRAAADQGRLGTAEEVQAQATRLLASDAARSALAKFFFAWLELDRVDSVPKDAARYPEFDRTVRLALREETRRFVQEVWWSGSGRLPELFEARFSFANAALAQFYREAGPSSPAPDGWGKIEGPAGRRHGLLTQGAFLSVHARSNSSSPVHRGVAVREKMFCQELPPPPPGLNAEPPPLDPTLTTRERYAAHSQVEPCRSCHHLIDPIGLGFEHFDGIGRHRTDDNGHPIDTTGEIVQTANTDGSFDGVSDLATRLAQSRDFHDCFSLQWFRYAYGTEETQATACALQQVQAGFRDANLSLDGLVFALVSSPHFVSRVGESTTSPEPTPEPEPEPTPGQNLDVSVSLDSEWATGYCNTVTVTNRGAAAAVWSIGLDVRGTLSQHWNTIPSGSAGRVTFRGVDWNATIQSNASARFGFCADL